MDIFERKERLKQQAQAEDDGRVADSMDVRRDLMAKVRAGELTLEQAQAELKKIKRGAKKSGQITRAQAYRGY